ncbi:SDR family NAD(P)-dependent oxidoreductase [Brevibacterium litoralis]|uniref:SDR family NAD(P)-dependent oxidoreductase n=1 Tax=Brevibacterium litoralis TaxID=3138935 RepID=UPI0032EEDE6E
MDITGHVALVTGGASGLGLATVEALLEKGAKAVVVADLKGEENLAHLDGKAHFVETNVAEEDQVAAAMDKAVELGDLRAVVHCAGIGGPMRLVQKDGSPGDLAHFKKILDVNLLGTIIVTSQAGARMAKNEDIDGERGVIVNTASVAAYDPQIGQTAYAASKGGVVSLTLCAARDYASKHIRVMTIAPGTVDTPLLARLSDDVRASLAAAVPHPARLARPDEYAHLATSIIENAMLNGEVIRMDGAIRMPPR